MKVVLCMVNSELYALDIRHVVSIERMRNIRPLPEAKPYLLGLVELRDEILHVISLKNWLGLKGISNMNGEERIIIVEIENKKVGLHVDATADVIQLDETEIQLLNNVLDTKLFKGVFQWDGKLVLLFEPSILFI